ncbi:MAG: hypothetical protein VKL39_04015 [Leptolyngbyaceae bacterium]|nr:hypothetical protein [Leptolyngbyaceae bacterium]
MYQSELASPLSETFTQWLEEQIRMLSVETLASDTITCTACGEIAGSYIIDYHGTTYRFPGPQTYAFLQFVASQS